MMILTQILAAYWTNIDELVFHTQTNEYEQEIRIAREHAERLLKETKLDKIIDEILKLNLHWEKSNNT